jgi:hypothetical protein
MADGVAETTLRSMLVNSGWRWSGCVQTYIIFNEDGSGEVRVIFYHITSHKRTPDGFECEFVTDRVLHLQLAYGWDQALFLACITEWKPLTDQDALALDRPLSKGEGEGLEALVRIQMTLTDRPPKHSGLGGRPSSQDTNLHKPALRPKEYTIQLERGKFPVIDEVVTGMCIWYLRHLHIEPSPYPPLEEWIRKIPMERHEPWKRMDFHRGEVEGDEFFDPKTGTTDVARRERMEQVRAKLARMREEREQQQAANSKD